MAPEISIIIPVLNEAGCILQTLSTVQVLRAAGNEVVVVDGGSEDGTIALCQPLSDHVIKAPRGRSRQMNAGAKAASGEIFLFLHADTCLPQNGDRLIIDALKRYDKEWGRFDIRLSGTQPLLRIVECLMNWRSRLTGIATGDQGIFVKRKLFEAVGGFPDIDLMEDVALSRILKRFGPPLCLRERVMTSSRRWEKNGILRTVFLMWRLRIYYALGLDPQHLARWYGDLKS